MTGPREVSLIASGAGQQQRADERRDEQRPDEVEGALERVVEALEDGRLELEERDRLPGDELGAVDEDLHRRRRDADHDAALVALVDELDRLALGELGVGDDDLVDAMGEHDVAQVLQGAQRDQPVVGPRLQRHEADDVDVVPAARGQRVRHVLDVLAGAHQHRAALVARRAQQEPRRALVGEAERRHVGDGEEERPVEDVVAGELLAADDRVERDHDRDLEERGDDARQARAHRAVAVEPRLGEQQRRDEEGEPHVVLGLVEHDRRVERVARGRLEPQGGGDGQEERERSRARAATRRARSGAACPCAAGTRARAGACGARRARGAAAAQAATTTRTAGGPRSFRAWASPRS